MKEKSKISMKRFLAGFCTAAFCMSAMLSPGMEELIPEIDLSVSAATEADAYITEFLSSAESTRVTVYDGTDESNYFMMNGRKYYHGFVMGDDSYREGGSITFNVETVDSLSFTLGRIDNSTMNGITLTLTRDGEWWQDISMGNIETWKSVELDLSSVSTLQMSISNTYIKYGFADFEIGGNGSSLAGEIPEYESNIDFISSCYDAYRIETFDASNEFSFFSMNGRKYYQGIVIGDDSYREGGSLTFNVETVDTLSFTLGRIDNTTMNDITMAVYRDGEWWQDISVGKLEIWKDVEFDLSEVSTLRLVISNTYIKYGLGNIQINGIPSEMPETVPEYETSEAFIKSYYDGYRVESYNGSNEANYFMMNGRKYYQGIVIGDDSYREGGSLTFNVENVDTLSFTMGRIDNSTMNGITMAVYRDGEWWQDVTVGNLEIWKDVEFDVSEISTIRLVITNTYIKYGIGNIRINGIEPAMTETSPEYETAEAFIKSAYDCYRTEAYNATTESSYFLMNGRKYYQGIVIGDDSYREGGSLTFNVENVDTLSFTLGRIDNTTMNGITLSVYRDGEWWRDIEMGSIETWRELEFDVSKLSTIRFVISNTYVKYGFGNIRVNGIEPAMTETLPEYETSEAFIKSAYDCYRTEAYNATTESSYFLMNGRKYYQGIVIGDDSYREGGSLTFNVENVDTLAFTLGRIDNTTMNDITMSVYRDGEWWRDIEMGNLEIWKELEFDVSKISTIRFVISNTYIKYGFGNITVNGIAPEMPATSPEYENGGEFIAACYDNYRTKNYDGSNEYNYFLMSGKEYTQGIVIGDNSYREGGSLTFNVENTDSVTFTLGRVDDSSETDIRMYVLKDGQKFCYIDAYADEEPKEYIVNTEGVSTLRFYFKNTYSQYAMANVAINGDYTEFTDGTYEVKAEVYTDPDAIISLEYLAWLQNLGDADQDTEITINDATMVLTHYAQIAAGLEYSFNEDEAYNEKIKSYVDINQDEMINITDATAILTYYAKNAAGLRPSWEDFMQ